MVGPGLLAQILVSKYEYHRGEPGRGPKPVSFAW
jgi:hypothetical protein